MSNVTEEQVKVEEHPDHFIVHRGQGSFKVAKNGLSATRTAGMQRLAMAGGGQVPDNGTQPLADLSDADLQAIEPWKPVLTSVAERTGQDPNVLAAIMLRESHGNPNAVGDGGHSHGAFQINDRFHKVPPDPADQAATAADILAQNQRRFGGDMNASLAAYNADGGAVARAVAAGKNPDSVTTGGDYGSWVMRQADAIRQRGLFRPAADAGGDATMPASSGAGQGEAPGASQPPPMAASHTQNPPPMAASHRSTVAQRALAQAQATLQGGGQPQQQQPPGGALAARPGELPIDVNLPPDYTPEQAAQQQAGVARLQGHERQPPASIATGPNGLPVDVPNIPGVALPPGASNLQQPADASNPTGGFYPPSTAQAPGAPGAGAPQQPQPAGAVNPTGGYYPPATGAGGPAGEQGGEQAQIDPAAAGLEGAYGPAAQNEAAAGFKQVLGGIQGQAIAESQKAEAAQATAEYAQKEYARLAQQRQQRFAQWQQRGEQLFQDAVNAKVDPNEFWATRSTPQKVSAVIGMMLGGYLSGKTGQPNPAGQLIDAAIQRDIDAQKANIGQKRFAWNMHLQMGASQQDADQLARADAYDQVAGQMAVSAAKYQGTSAAAQLQQASGQLRLQGLQARQQIASTGLDMDNKLLQRKVAQFNWMYSISQLRAIQQMTGQGNGTGEQGSNGGTGIPPSGTYLLPQEMQDQAVRDRASGNMVLANSKEDKVKYNDVTSQIDRLANTTVRMREYLKQQGLSAHIPWTSQSDRGYALMAEFKAAQSKLQELGFRGKAADALDAQTPQLFHFDPSRVGEELNNAQDYINQMYGDASNLYLRMPQRKSFSTTPRG